MNSLPLICSPDLPDSRSPELPLDLKPSVSLNGTNAVSNSSIQTEVSAMERNCMGNVAAIQIVTQIVCEKFSLTFERITAKAQQSSVSLPRRIAFYLIRELAEIPFAQIGSAFRENHSTVVHGVQSLRNRIETEPKFAAMVQDLRCAAQARLAQSESFSPGNGQHET